METKITINYHPVWNLAFRPFFLMGSIAAMTLMVLWSLYLLNFWSVLPYSNAVLWHAHEMIFGFSGAIIVGFLLTASQNWSGVKGIHGQPLKALFMVWLAARILPFLGLPNLLSAGIDLLFIPFVIKALIPQLSIPTQKHNRIFFVLLGLFEIANLFTQCALSEINPQLAPYGIRLAIAVILLIIMVITGRIIPFFTRRVIPNSKLQKLPWLEKACFSTSIVFFMAYILMIESPVLSILAIPAFCFHLMRWLYWHPVQSLKTPILAILYAGYMWLIVGFFLYSFELIHSVMPGLPLHAWTAGAIGVLIYGMITRVSLGHTGRNITSSPLINAGYIAINLAVFIRVICPLFLPDNYFQWLISASILWSMAFLFLIWVYFPILTRARIDGKEG